ncbi:hypothetical protein [Candidatus Macondimonas diazotrophica]|uniref:Uncharacterized protein n=1 Tax=Candidatus Macondimonas diazotrophica TaxID=2305248 RepID=A0A4Z0F6C2_9GAMM|nr:hypothetical protein [Candidatus Macondimonas diazotrophica]TFZ80125.1 hypothetical protein E4680_13920 [Candidatus Macondimonas diazotrophica]
MIFRVVWKIRGIPVGEFLCKRRQVDSLKKAVAKMIPVDGEVVSFDIYQGFNNTQQRKGMPIQWEHVETIFAGSDLLDY